MVYLEIKYSTAKDESVNMNRTIAKKADVKNALGEMIYGIECQTKSFTTHDVFEEVTATLPAKAPARKKKFASIVTDDYTMDFFVKTV